MRRLPCFWKLPQAVRTCLPIPVQTLPGHCLSAKGEGICGILPLYYSGVWNWHLVCRDYE